jgi:hypothetical protein
MDALRAVLRELDGCLCDVDAARQCCARICEPLSKDTLLRIEAARDGAVMPAVLAAAVAHAADAVLQKDAWGAFVLLLLCVPESETGAATLACRGSVLPAGVRALQMHLSNDAVQERVCTVLARLICGDESLAPQLGDLGAVEASVASLREHCACDCTAAAVMHLLFTLVKQQRPRNCARALQVDVVEAIAAAIRTHDADVRLACRGYSILACFCPFDDFVPRAAASNIVDLVISGLRRLAADDVDRRTAACLLLSKLCVHEAMVRKFVASGGAPAILAALRARPIHNNVLDFGVATLLNCCMRAPDLSCSLVAAGAVEGVVSAMEAQKASCSRVLRFGYQALVRLTAADTSAIQRAINAGALRLPRTDDKQVELIRNALFQRLNDAASAADAAASAKADAAMAELLAEEEAAGKAGGSAASKKKSKAKKAAGGAGGAGGAEGVVPAAVPLPAAPAARGAEGAAASTAAKQPAAPPPAAPMSAPSAAAERRRRRAATKAARRTGAAASGVAAAAAASSDDDAAPDDAAVGSGMAAGATEEAQPAAASEHPLESMFPWLRLSSNAAAPPGASPPLPPPLPPLPRATLVTAPPAPSAHDAQLAAMVAQLAEQKAAMAAKDAAMAAQATAIAAKDAALAKLKAEADAAPKCSICLDATPCVVLLPCRHQPLCGAPACAAMLGSPPLCPLCREPVADTMHTFV